MVMILLMRKIQVEGLLTFSTKQQFSLILSKSQKKKLKQKAKTYNTRNRGGLVTLPQGFLVKH